MKSATISLSTLEGAAVMNNTWCLGIFLYVIWLNGFDWRFTAETLNIIIIELWIG
jgi:hypothetical protein